MSEQTVTPTTPAAPVPPATTPDAGAVTPAGQEPQAPAQPFAVFDTADAFNKRLDRESRKLLNKQAKALGFEDWQDMQESVAATRQPPAETPTPGPAEGTTAAAPNQPTAAQPDEASRLRMALQVGTKLNLPTALVGRLQGATAEEMEADAQALLGLMTAPRGPGIPHAPTQGQPVTFTKTQLQNPAFVREHQAEIMQAAREGRIVDS